METNDTKRVKKIIIKISGECFTAEKDLLKSTFFLRLIKELKCLIRHRYGVAVINGGGNWVRGKEMGNEKKTDLRIVVDKIGMLSTSANSLLLNYFFEKNNLGSFLRSFHLKDFVSQYDTKESLNLLEKGNILQLVGGTGLPFFSNDTAAAILAADLEASLVIFAKGRVDGIYTADPYIVKDAELIPTITYSSLIKKGISVIDPEALHILKTAKIKSLVINFKNLINLVQLIEEVIKSDSFLRKGSIILSR